MESLVNSSWPLLSTTTPNRLPLTVHQVPKSFFCYKESSSLGANMIFYTIPKATSSSSDYVGAAVDIIIGIFIEYFVIYISHMFPPWTITWTMTRLIVLEMLAKNGFNIWVVRSGSRLYGFLSCRILCRPYPFFMFHLMLWSSAAPMSPIATSICYSNVIFLQ